MAENQSIFKKMDTFLFAKIDQIKQGSTYTQFIQSLSSLSEQQRKPLNLITSLVILLMPTILFFYLGIQGIKMKNRVGMKKEILEISNTILTNTKSLEQAGRNFFSSIPISSKNDFINKVQNSAKLLGINLDLIKIENFQSKSNQFSLTQTSVDLIFKDFTISQLTALLASLSQKDKIQLGKLDLQKSTQNNMMNGSVQLTHSGKGVGSER